MRRRWYYIWGILVAGCVIAAMAFWPSDEPSYEGRTLSQWLDVGDHYYQASDCCYTNTGALGKAVLHMGPNAIPILVRYVKYEVDPWQIAALKFLRTNLPNSSLTERLVSRISQNTERRANATRAIVYLGPRAEAAIPALIRCLDRPQKSPFAMDALVAIGEKSIPALLAAQTNAVSTNPQLASNLSVILNQISNSAARRSR
jgi:hypothetical protein